MNEGNRHIKIDVLSVILIVCICIVFFWGIRMVSSDINKAKDSEQSAQSKDGAVNNQGNDSESAYIEDTIKNGIKLSDKYTLVTEQSSWDEAMEKSKEMGGRLVVLETAEEFRELTTLLEEKGMRDVAFWIGGSREANSNDYFWNYADGKVGGKINDVPEYSSIWMSGEPTYKYKDLEERYLNLFYYDTEEKWVINDCPLDMKQVSELFSGEIGFICEFGDEEPVLAESSNISQDIKEVVKVTYEDVQENGNSFARYTGLTESKEVVWQKTSSSGASAQLSHSSEIGINQTGYYYTDGGDVVKLDKNTGNELWRVTGYNIYGPCHVFDGSGNLYISRHFGDQLIVITADGKLAATEKIPENYVRMSDIHLKGDIVELVFELSIEDDSTEQNSPSLYFDIKNKRWIENEGDMPYQEFFGESTNIDFGTFAGEYIFASGVGAWETRITIHQDGSFEGKWYDANAGTSGEGYDAEVMNSIFQGKFTDQRKMDEFTYTAVVSELTFKDVGNEVINDRTKNVYLNTANGIEAGIRFKFYKRGRELSLKDDHLYAYLETFGKDTKGGLSTEVLDGMDKGGVFVKY